MFAETGLMFPYFQSFPSEVQQLEDFCCSQEPNVSMGSNISEYDLGGEGDLFKAPQPIIEEPLMGLDPMTAAISMISCSEDAISPQGLQVSDLETSFENEQLLSEVFYECKNDLFGKDASFDMPLSEVLDMKIPIVKADENLDSEGSFQKSISSGCLSSMDWMHGPPMRPNFIDFGGMDFGAAYGMRRAFSEGDIKTLGNGNINLIHSPRGQPQTVGSSTSETLRKEQLSRYRNKKNKRNFGRKIKYACRKALADSQPRIRGRFAKTEEIDTSKKH
ncbi:zinc finger protein CONSTANS-LIKE 10 isoform X2 [Lycium ferocissimum]|uniref:zinc finger protein CONSTANS-LIKE 10 isoform X2 n=1 Tax=Lycium ferocissimum TaxID=112874 RepID=UPI0028152DC7|nr:zinc finger protein CONSTANS-LIKE 10 isoform X2 [Lycium ferocissimum]